ncbi:hypothetical protein LB529_16545 [Mesorhizobium sp. CA5]|nr:hypothetical protein [Mesorhizobium sp. CA5]
MPLLAAPIARRLLPGRGVYAFDEATLAAQKLAETDEVRTPMCVRIIEDRLQY